MFKKFPVSKVVSGLLLVCLSQPVAAKVLLELDGEIKQGGLVVGSTSPGNNVYFDKDSYHFITDCCYVASFCFVKDCGIPNNTEWS